MKQGDFRDAHNKMKEDSANIPEQIQEPEVYFDDAEQIGNYIAMRKAKTEDELRAEFAKKVMMPITVNDEASNEAFLVHQINLLPNTEKYKPYKIFFTLKIMYKMSNKAIGVFLHKPVAEVDILEQYSLRAVKDKIDSQARIIAT